VKLRLLWAILPVILVFGLNEAQAAEKIYSNNIGMEFVLIPAGKFMMGSKVSDKGARADEKPRHRVTISKDFYLSKYEVTQEQWELVMGSNPSEFSKFQRIQ
jgi:formylglycine-generating enzyme required for sulfatase activity